MLLGIVIGVYFSVSSSGGRPRSSGGNNGSRRPVHAMSSSDPDEVQVSPTAGDNEMSGGERRRKARLSMCSEKKKMWTESVSER